MPFKISILNMFLLNIWVLGNIFKGIFLLKQLGEINYNLQNDLIYQNLHFFNREKSYRQNILHSSDHDTGFCSHNLKSLDFVLGGMQPNW